MRYFLLSILTVFLAGQLPGQSGGPRTHGYESISIRDLKAHLTFLSSDELEGRETSYQGQRVAAQYIASMFRKTGLTPVGENGTYFQHFPLHVFKAAMTTSIEVRKSGSISRYSARRDFLTAASVETTLTAPMVFVGFMDARLSEDEERFVRGKIAVGLTGRKDEWKTKDGRRRSYARHVPGAAATIAITHEDLDGTLEDMRQRFANLLEKGEMGLPYHRNERQFGQLPLFYAGPAMGSELLGQLGKSMEDLRTSVAEDQAFTPKVLNGVTATITVNAITDTVRSENVVGLIEGSDPALRDQVVVLTAHYDHEGISARTGEIYNGADDNGSGTSLLLELAEAFAHSPQKPKRSLLFMAVTGEEKGLYGSRWYSDHPLIPLEQTVANLNIDMIGRTDRTYSAKNNSRYVYVVGSDKISPDLDSLLQVANMKSVDLFLDYTYNADDDPNQFYRRSDHYHFARKGVPAVFFFGGLHDDYHRPTDTEEKIEYEKLLDIGRLVYTLTWEVADFRRPMRRAVRPAASH